MAAETKRERVSTRIRGFLPADAAAVTGILKESPQAGEWAEANVVESARWSGVVALVAEHDGKVIGFIIGRQVVDQAEILNLAVRQAERRRGEGGALLEAVIAEFLARQVNYLFLEVRESNEAGIAFYTRHGFVKTGCRPSYYRNPEEAAIVMELKLAH